MGFLDWRGSNRLDDLDRRVGFREEWTEQSLRRHERFLWVAMVVIVFLVNLNAAQREWAWVGVDSLLAVWNGRALQKVRTARRY